MDSRPPEPEDPDPENRAYVADFMEMLEQGLAEIDLLTNPPNYEPKDETDGIAD